jgi:hypothetical protein
MGRLTIKKGIHYTKYIQSGMNLQVDQLAEEVYQFTVVDYAIYRPLDGILDGATSHKPFIVTPETDLQGIPLDILEELDMQMSYEGECDDEQRAAAKGSKTRRHLRDTIQERQH